MDPTPLTVDINPAVRLGMGAVKQYPVIPEALSITVMDADGSGQSRLTDEPAADFALSRSGAGSRKPHRVRPVPRRELGVLRAEEKTVVVHGICRVRRLGIARAAGVISNGGP